MTSLRKKEKVGSFNSSCDSTGYQDGRTWLIDGRSSRHMTGTCDMFLSVAESGGWLSDSEDERETAVVPSIQSLVQGEESESLQNTGRRLGQYKRIEKAQDGRAESFRSSDSRVVFRHISSY